MKHFFYLVLLLIVTGCASLPTPAPKPESGPVGIVSYPTIKEELVPLMVEGAKLIIMDGIFAAPPEEIVRKFIAEAIAKTDLRYRPNLWDCENEAADMVVNYHKIFRKFYGEVEVAAPVGLIGLAIMPEGIHDLKIRPSDEIRFHAMVLCRCQGGRWLVVEPMLGTVTELSGLVYEDVVRVFLIIL